MYPAAIPSEPESLFPFIQEWIHALCRLDYEGATQLLYHGGEWAWTAEELQRAVETDDYGAEDLGYYHATPYETAKGENPREFYDENDGPGTISFLHPTWPVKIVFLGEPSLERPTVIGRARIHYALNGKWSDVSSNFSIHRLAEGYAFELRSIEVE